jgi:anti-sigma-K factor RskA
MSPLNFEEMDELAGEYVLGTLPYAQRQQVEQRLATDAPLCAAVNRWQEQLLPLTRLAEPVQPTAQLWQRIESSLQAQSQGTAARIKSAQDAPPPTVAQPAGQALRQPVKTAPSPGWWSSISLWRGLAGTGFAAAAVLAAVLVTRMGPLPGGAPAQYLVVLVAPGGNAPGWVVQASGAQQLSLIPVSQTSVPADKTLQFWTKGATWAAPVSLGLVKPGDTVRVPIDKLPPLQPNQLFELTLEPPGGSPTGKPTGPIQFIGRAVKVT